MLQPGIMQQERSLKVVFKYIHLSENVDDIIKEIENHGYIVTNIGISRDKTLIRQYLPCSMSS